MYSDAKFIQNSSEKAFEEPGRTVIGQYVIEAAGYFLNSQSDFLLLLNKIEMMEIDGIDYAELQQVINNTVIDMEKARAKYYDLIQLADSTPIAIPRITQLMNFNYMSFQESKGLNSGIYDEVKTYLIGGDVRGLYYQFLANIQSILDRLNLIKADVDAEVIPSTSGLWRVNQLYTEALLFGQYTAEIFYSVTGK